MDEARRHGLEVDERRLARDLGVPVVPTVARTGEGLPELLAAVADVASGRAVPRPRRVGAEAPALKKAVDELEALVEAAFPGLPNGRWVALRLLDGDERVAEAVRTGEVAELAVTPGAQGDDAATPGAVAEARGAAS